MTDTPRDPGAGERPAPRAGERIAKLLARAGIASRREVERMIEDGRIAIHGTVLTTPATVLTTLDGVTVDGQPVQAPEPTRLFLYHKPPGLLVTERDPRERPTIYDHLPDDLPRVVPVGRLDLATEGLLLLTTDGGLKRQLELPATGVERAYRARAYGPVTQQQLEDLSQGIEIEGIRYGSIDANIERRTGANVWIEMTLTEGKNREVRRVLEHLGLQVSRLIRIRYGPFVLGELEPGQLGEVKQHDLVDFRKSLGRAPALSASLDVPNAPVAPAVVTVEARRAAPAARAPRPAPARSLRPAREPERPFRIRPASEGGPVRPQTPRAATTERPFRIREVATDERSRTSRPYAKPGVDRDTRTDRPARTDATKPRFGDRNARSDAPRTERTGRDAPRTGFAKPEGGGRSGRQGERGAFASRDRAPADETANGRTARTAARTPYAGTERVRTDRTHSDDRGAPRPTAGKPAGGKPAKGPAGGRGHPPRTPRGGKR